MMFASSVARVNAVLMLEARPPLRVAEIMRRAGTSQVVTESALRTLEKRGLIEVTRPHGHDLFAPDKESPYYPAALHAALVDIDIRSYLPEDALIVRIYAYGSVPDGKAAADSDLDLLIVGKINEREATKSLRALGDIIGREIDVITRTTAEIEEVKDNNDSFIRQALDGACVWRSS